MEILLWFYIVIGLLRIIQLLNILGIDVIFISSGFYEIILQGIAWPYFLVDYFYFQFQQGNI